MTLKWFGAAQWTNEMLVIQTSTVPSWPPALLGVSFCSHNAATCHLWLPTHVAGPGSHFGQPWCYRLGKVVDPSRKKTDGTWLYKELGDIIFPFSLRIFVHYNYFYTPLDFTFDILPAATALRHDSLMKISLK